MFVILLLYTTAPVICLTELGVKEDCERVFSVSHKRREFVCTSTRVYRGMFVSLCVCLVAGMPE